MAVTGPARPGTRRAPARSTAIGALSADAGPDIAGAPADAGPGSGSRYRIRAGRGARRGLVTVLLGGVVAVSAGLLVVAAVGYVVGRLTRRRGAGSSIDRVARPWVALALALARGRPRTARPVVVRRDRGRRPAARGVPGQTFGIARTAPRLLAGRRWRGGAAGDVDRSGACVFRRPTADDHPRIIGVIDDWWGGRRVRHLLPRLWLEHFPGPRGSSSGRTGGWPASSSASSARTTRRSPTST